MSKYRETHKQAFLRKQREYRMSIYRTVGQWIVVTIQIIILLGLFGKLGP